MKILLPEMVRFYKEVIWGGEPARLRGKWETVDELIEYSASLGYSLTKENLFNPMIEYPGTVKSEPEEFVSYNLAEVNTQKLSAQNKDNMSKNELNSLEWEKVFYKKYTSEVSDIDSMLLHSDDTNQSPHSNQNEPVNAIVLIDQYCGVQTKLKNPEPSHAELKTLQGDVEDFATMLNLNIQFLDSNNPQRRKKFLQKVLSEATYSYQYRLIGDFQMENGKNQKTATVLYKKAESVLKKNGDSNWRELRDLAFSVIKHEISQEWEEALIKQTIINLEGEFKKQSQSKTGEYRFDEESVLINEYKEIIQYLSQYKNTQLLIRFVLKRMQIVVDIIISKYSGESSEHAGIEPKDSLYGKVDPILISMSFVRVVIDHLQGKGRDSYLEKIIEKVEVWFLKVKPITNTHVDNFIELGKEIIVFTKNIQHGKRLLKKAEVIAVQIKDDRHLHNIQQFVTKILKDEVWAGELQGSIDSLTN